MLRRCALASHSGNIVAVVGIKNSYTGGHALRRDDNRPRADDLPEPVIQHVHRAQDRRGQAQALRALMTIRREDPSFRFHFDDETAQTIISGMGELHLDIIRTSPSANEDQRRGSASPASPTARPSPVRSSTSGASSAKQTGGRGQFGDVSITLVPYTAPRQGEDEIDFTDLIAFETTSSRLDPQGVHSSRRGRQSARPPLGRYAATPSSTSRSPRGRLVHAVDSSQMAFEQPRVSPS